MPSVELHYFNVTGLGHSLRLLLAQSGQEFQDIRITDEEWDANEAAYKAKYLFGQVPVLIIDGKQYAQSQAIARYLGRKYGLAGADIEEDLEIDQNVAFIKDIFNEAALVHYEDNEEVKERKQEEMTKSYYPVNLKKLHDILEKNKGYLALGKLTWGDFLFVGPYSYLKHMMQRPDLDEEYPLFKQLVDRVQSLPNVKAFLDTSPKLEL